jgi:hypothetical protein
MSNILVALTVDFPEQYGKSGCQSAREVFVIGFVSLLPFWDY